MLQSMKESDKTEQEKIITLTNFCLLKTSLDSEN